MHFDAGALGSGACVRIGRTDPRTGDRSTPGMSSFRYLRDQHGNVIHLGERDCSIQRRHQKVIEEAPCACRLDLPCVANGGGGGRCGAAPSIMSAPAPSNFCSIASGEFYFLEMNTRLQVEHPVTEAITGLDLVDWQLRIAAGERLPLEQHEVGLTATPLKRVSMPRIRTNNFLPQSGT